MIRQILLGLLFTTFLGAQTLVYENAIPVGTKNGSNRIFTLETSPNPIESLKAYKNGLRLTVNTDYILSASTITYQVAPSANDVLVVDYLAASTIDITLLPQLVTETIVPFGVVQNTTPIGLVSLPGTNPATLVDATSGNFKSIAYNFSATTNNSLQFPVLFPDGWSGDISLEVFFSVSNTGPISIQARTACVAIGSALSAASTNTYTSISSYTVATADALNRLLITPIPKTSCQAGFLGMVQVTRDAQETIAASADTNSGTLSIYAMRYRYTYDLNELTQ